MTPVMADKLRQGTDIAAVLGGQRRGGRYLVVHTRQRLEASQPRIAVVASRRVGGAVQRNRAKRLLREAARRLVFAGGHDVVLVARRPILEVGFAEVLTELEALAVRLGVLDRSP